MSLPRRYRLAVCAIAAAATLVPFAALEAQQRTSPAAVGSRGISAAAPALATAVAAPLAAPAPQPAAAPARSTGPGDAAVALGGVLGGSAGLVVGALTGAILGSRICTPNGNHGSCSGESLAGGVVGGVVGMSTMIPVGAHIANGRRGALGRSLLISTGIAALGSGALAVVSASNEQAWAPGAVGVIVVAVPVTQIVSAVATERRARR